MSLAAIFFDLGDVIMREESEIKDGQLNTLRADLVEGMGEALRTLKARGHTLGLVADTRPLTARNVLSQHNVLDLFDTLAISEEVGCVKPDARIFRAALDALNLSPADYARVLMVGNNLARDVRGANALGLTSVYFHWNNRYPGSNDPPTYTVHNARELLELIERLQ
jgi:HAD superfamily hydrolase (TIGR01549 family)